ncbi:Putative leucine-rich repeat domain superfamily [Septoria linicola]|uniref:Leucine-rich repeat domain superfamily n=1 Tax=Septoria linicola TaxID=215465 RepID=A0A9Q9EGT3_9PEZI|nr:putative leucine-rich repeat domain superfamily [Septoria linicola]USW51121.1 Putative leucine-rich repeat domain superfamily [Septoria linicola]
MDPPPALIIDKALQAVAALSLDAQASRTPSLGTSKAIDTTATMSTTTRFGQLAAELHIAIAQRCNGEQLLALRQVCRNLAKDTTDVFARHFFTYVSCDIDGESLQRLCDLSAVGYLARHIRTLSLSVRGVADFVYHASEVVLLAQSMKALTKLGAAKELHVEACPWLTRRAMKTLAPPPTDLTFNIDIVHEAMISSSFVPSKFRYESPMPLDLPQSSLNPQAVDQLCQIWAHLEHVQFSIDSGDWATAPNFPKLLQSATKLRTLGIFGYNSRGALDIFSWLRTSTLRSLSLSQDTLCSQELCDILTRFASSLKRLELVCIDLVEENGWLKVLEHIRDHMHLDHLSVRSVKSGLDDVLMHFGIAFRTEFTIQGRPLEMRVQLDALLEQPRFGDEDHATITTDDRFNF